MTDRAAGYRTRPRVDLVDAAHRPVRLRPTVRRLLVILLGSPDGITTGQLTASLWPDRAPTDPAAALATALSRLRAHLPAGTLTREDDLHRLQGLPGPGAIPPPLAGRDDDLHTLARLLATHDGVLVSGPPGIGRTRLLGEAAGDDRFERLTIADDVDRLTGSELGRLRTHADATGQRILAAAADPLRADPALLTAIADGSWAHHRLERLRPEAARRLAATVGADPSLAASGNPQLIVAGRRDASGDASPRGLREAIAARIAGADSTAPDVLAALCLAGRLDWAAAERLTSHDCLDVLVRADLITADEAGVTPAWTVLRETVVDGLDTLTRRRLVGRLMDALPAGSHRAQLALSARLSVPSSEHGAAARELLASGEPDAAQHHAALAFAAEPGPVTAIDWLPTLLFGSLDAAALTPPLATIMSALTAADRHDPQVVAFAAATAFLKSGDVEAAMTALGRTSSPHPITAVVANLLDTYSGRPDPAAARQLAETSDDPMVRQAAWSSWYLAAQVTGTADLVAVLDHLTPATSGLTPAQLSAMRARARIPVGDFARARAHLSEAMDLTSESDLRAWALLHTIRSELAFYSGDPAAAVPGARRCAELLRTSGHRSDERMALQWLALMLACADHPEESADALAAARRLPLAAVLGEHVGALAEAVVVAGGSSNRLRREARRVTELAAAHGINAAPLVRAAARVLPGHNPDRLTARERQIATLVRQRWTATEIAGELGLSPRTVQNHTAAAYRKLGIHRRSDLPDDL